MKKEINETLKIALSLLDEKSKVDLSSTEIEIKENKGKKFGDYSTNLALILAQELKIEPDKIAKALIKEIPANPSLEKIEFAKPGFINFFIKEGGHSEILKTINREKEDFGLSYKSSSNKKKKILIEYVSSNPTGPLHVGHGRGAAFGSVLSSILRATGHEVDEEYYVNDQGRQIDILTVSVLLRYEQLLDNKIPFPKGCYQGDYIKLYAKKISKLKKKNHLVPPSKRNFLITEIKRIKKDEDLDILIKFLKENLKERFHEAKKFIIHEIITSIKLDLKKFGVKQNLWFKETTLYRSLNKKPSLINKVKTSLKKTGFIYEKDGALWFKSTKFNDDKDRVIEKENGQATYFASDIAYHFDKYQRGYDKIINVWGADHHGYLPRVRSAMLALKQDPKKLEVIFIQFASLLREGKKISMSTRGGEFISLSELMEEVSAEAARFFFINRKTEQHLDFDLDLAKEESKDNPLYYVQYAHARICSVFKKLKSESKNYDYDLGEKKISILSGNREIEIQKLLSQFPEVILRAANNYEPHLICYYLRNLASSFHSYYNEERFLVENEDELQARLFMLKAIKQVLFNGLSLLGLSAPTSM